MAPDIKPTSWVYVVVQNPGGDEQIVGQKDSDNDIAFIPLFLDRDSAMEGMLNMPREKGKKLEIQAIIYEDLESYAAEAGFILFVLDAEGRVIDRRSPNQPSS